MSIKNSLLFLILCLASFGLAAQPINLGGEDTAVGPLLPPPNSQVYDPAPWAAAFSQGRNVNISSPIVNVGTKYVYALTDRPGEIIAYRELNLLFFLEDYVAFQEYFLNKVYEKKKLFNDDNSDLVIFNYPIVRQYLAGSLSYAENPRHLPLIKSGLNTDFTNLFNKATTVRSLYELALENASTPTNRPRFLFDQCRSLFDVTVPEAIIALESVIQKKMAIEYGKINPRASQTLSFQVESWSASDLAAVVEEVAKSAVNRKDKKVINELIPMMSDELITLQGDKAALLAAYTFHGEVLSKQEQVWFQWVIRNSEQIIEDLNVTLTYLTEVSELPTNETTYAHFFNVTCLLRDALGRVRELPKEAEAKLVLDQLTADYLEKVLADIAAFEEL
jgi:hypothetical protein